MLGRLRATAAALDAFADQAGRGELSEPLPLCHRRRRRRPRRAGEQDTEVIATIEGDSSQRR